MTSSIGVAASARTGGLVIVLAGHTTVYSKSLVPATKRHIASRGRSRYRGNTMMVYSARWQRGWLALVVSFVLAGALAGRAVAAPDPRELSAREDFAAGRYQVALEVFARLYAETLHPNYLRNIGRCYQNLGEPERAITSFRDYLRKGRNISADEHVEIEGYIKEMQDLERQRAAASAPKPAAPVVPLVASAPAPSRPTATVDLTVKSAPPAPPSEASPPVYERWWFWAIVVGVAGAGVGVAAASGAFKHINEPPCMTGFGCGGQ
jgi:hypothetical protein